MKDFAKRKSQATLKKSKNRPSYKARHSQEKVIPNSQLFFLLFLAIICIFTSLYYFGTDIKTFEPREINNKIEFNFPTKFEENEILIKVDAQNNNNVSCIYLLQVETYGKKEYANETLEAVKNEGEAIIDEVDSVARPGKIFYRVLIGPYANRSQVNNSRERLIEKGYSPLVRQSCSKK